MIRENSMQDHPDNHKHVNTTRTVKTTTLRNVDTTKQETLQFSDEVM